MNPRFPLTPLLRFVRFNLVGALGVAVQLSSLAVFNLVLPRHLLLTSSAAVELTVLHNFRWHLRYTWPDRSGSSTLPQLLRFHLSNGLVSLAGNLILMRLFVHSARLPILPANLLAILCCGLANFLLAHHWAFRSQERPLDPQNVHAEALMFRWAVSQSHKSGGGP